MAQDYVHLAQNGEEIGWEIRSYNAVESTFEHNGKEILLIEVEADNCTFCDGSYAQNLSGANIEGYILKWKYRKNEEGLPVSEIERIRDRTEQKGIAKNLKPRYAISQINFA